jgi:hypothetical protein
MTRRGGGELVLQIPVFNRRLKKRTEKRGPEFFYRLNLNLRREKRERGKKEKRR